MKLIAGLGNPGRSYSRHRHNVGFAVLDLLSQRHDIKMQRRSFGALTGSGVIESQAVVLAKPQTFMNLSGESVASLAGYYKIDVGDIMVVHDDIDIGFGHLKIAKDSGHGGHNGIRSILESLNDAGFVRVRVGVGRPPQNVDPASYVLSPFLEGQQKEVGSLIESAADAVEMLISKGLAAAQQKYH